MKILQEYLYFREDTSVSNKFFIVDGSRSERNGADLLRSVLQKEGIKLINVPGKLENG